MLYLYRIKFSQLQQDQDSNRIEEQHKKLFRYIKQQLVSSESQAQILMSIA